MNFNTLRPSIFDFKLVGNSCDILENAVNRYKGIIQNHLRRVRVHKRSADGKWKTIPEYQGHLVRTEEFICETFEKNHKFQDFLQVDLKKDCEVQPHAGMDESCKQ